MVTDTERIDFIEKIAKRSRTGISFDWVPSDEGEHSGYRMMSSHLIRQSYESLRDSIDAAMQAV